MRKIIRLVSIAVALALCAIVVYELWRDIRYDREIPQYLQICMQQSAQPLAEARGEVPSKQSPSQIQVASQDVFTALKTKMAMTVLALSIASYAHDNGHLPESIEMLGLDQKELVDGWSTKFAYVRDSEKTFILCSPGSNRVFDGDLVNGEIAGRFSPDIFEEQLKGNSTLLRYIEHRGYLGKTR
jgi:hypothetical protein